MKLRTTPFVPVFPRDALGPLIALLRSDAVQARRLAADVAAWQQATAPRLLQAPPSLGFDLALIRGIPGTEPDAVPVGPLCGLVRLGTGQIRTVSVEGADLSAAAEPVLVRRIGDEVHGGNRKRSRRNIYRPAQIIAFPEATLALPAMAWTDPRPADARKGAYPAFEPGALVSDWLDAVLERASGRITDTVCLPAPVTLSFSSGLDHHDGQDRLFAWSADHRSASTIATCAPDTAQSAALKALDEQTVAAGKPFTLPAGVTVDLRAVMSIARSWLTDALKAADKEVRRRANRAFLTRLDPAVVGSMTATGNAKRGPALYNWLQAADDARRSTLRRQALEVYPLLLGMPKRPPELDAVIDGAGVLEGALAAALNIPVPAVRALQGVRGDALMAAGLDDPDGLIGSLPLMHGLPPGHWPSRGSGQPPVEQQWAGLHHVVRTVLQLAQHTTWHEPVLRGTVGTILASEKPIWRAPDGAEPCQAMARDVFLIHDTIRGFSNAVLMPLAIDAMLAAGWEPGYNELVRLLHAGGTGDEATRTAIATAFVRNRPLGRLQALAQHYHEHEGRIDAELVARTDPRDWPALTAPHPVTVGGERLEVVPLTTAGQLAHEGAGQGHCVASYVTQCMYENCHIVSIRRTDGTVLSTAELRLADPDDDALPHPGITVRQHQGPKNGDPPAAAVTALESYLEAIRDSRLTVDLTALQAALNERVATRPTNVSDLAQCVGYDPMDASARDAALQAWAFVLPRDERGLSHADWAERIGLPELLQERMATLAPPVWRRAAA